jgi:hypothetical protein
MANHTAEMGVWQTPLTLAGGQDRAGDVLDHDGKNA